MRLALVLVLAIALEVASADVQLRARLETPGPAWVGQRVPIIVELLTPTSFASAPVFELPEVPGAVLMRMEEHPTLGTETVDGVQHVVQRHELALFAMRPGAYDVPPFPVRFASAAEFGQQPVAHRLTTPALHVEARMSPGTEHVRGLVSSTRLEVEERWDPGAPEHVRVGDAFTRTITRTATDVPGMALPPLPFKGIDGLAVYPRPPVVQDRSERGQFIGTRVDAVTYVCERPGRMHLPGIRVSWWNVERQEPESVQLPAVDLEIGRAPLSRATRLWISGLAGGALVLGLLALWRSRDRLATAWRRRRAAWENGEGGRFARVQRACREGNAVAAYNALLAWLEVIHSGDDPATIAADLLATGCTPELRERVRELAEAVTNGTRWDGPVLASGLQSWRRERRHRTATPRQALPALNPRKASHNLRGS